MRTYHVARPALVVASIAVVAGCAQQRAQPLARSLATTAPSLVLVQRVVPVDTQAYEPMILEHPDGLLFVSGAGGLWGPAIDSVYYAQRGYWDSLRRDRLWKSRDNGASWSQVDLGPSAVGVIGNSDMDIVAAPDGTLYYASMTWIDSIGEGRQIAMGVSRDVGATWRWRVLSSQRFDDRPWVRVAPDGTVHVIWNDGEGVQHVVSRDGGDTWSKPSLVHLHAGSSHLAVGPKGEVAVRLIPWAASHNFRNPGVDLIAVSTDAGEHWTMRPAPGERDWGTWAVRAVHLRLEDGAEAYAGDKARHRCCSGNVIPRWIEPLAWDGRGRLYSLWTDTTGVWLARSADRGATWDKWRVVESRVRCFFPYLVARGDGDLAATWHCGKGDGLRWQAARITVGHGTAVPLVVQSPPLELDAFESDPTRKDAVRRAPAGEYLAAVLLRDGTLGVVTPVQGPVRSGFTWWRFDLR
jgi:hypothetical protein